MAGGKETPRQKMIGMMYLVLTALLALNVSKQVIAAFVTINDKLDRSANIINQNNQSNYSSFDKKITTVKAQGGDVESVKVWQERAFTVQNRTTQTVSYLLSEANDMIKASEGTDWVAEDGKDENGNIIALKPLADILGMDNYDIPTNMFIGGNPQKPVQRGLNLRDSVIAYRNAVAEVMGNYEDAKGKYTFTAPESLDGLSEALATANSADTAAIAAFMRSLDIPEMINQRVHGHDNMIPWPSAMFDHAPIVAAAAMLTALKLDIKNSESMATDFLLSKVDVQEFDFNKIEPLAFASSGYINQGDSLNLRVMIAAYDSTEVPDIRWGMDADTSNTDNWKPATNASDGSISIRGDQPGQHLVKGVIYVKQRGVPVAKPWSFDFAVGQPMGVVALPEMRVLYRGYDNIVEGTASGFPADRVTLSGSGCSISKKGNQYIAKVGSGVREANISVMGKKDDGGSVNLGSFKFKVKALPTPGLYLGGIESGQSPGLSNVKAQTRVSCRYDESVPLTGVKFNISGGTVTVDGIMRKGKINPGGGLDSDAQNILKQSKGKQVSILVNYRGPDGVSKRTAMIFQTK
jgi:gliding motility-associated protein GldM